MKTLLLKLTYGRHSTLGASLREMGHRVDEVDTPSEALRTLELHRYDAAILDVQRWDEDALGTVRRLRAISHSCALIMICEPGSAQQRVAALEAGSDDVVDRGYAFDELLARIRAQVRRHGGSSSELLTNGAIRLYQQHRRVYVQGKVVELTYKEFGVLAHLLVKCGEVVSRTELLQSVWHVRDQRGSNLVDVYVGRLRAKLEDAARYLDTVRGVGYRLAHAEAEHACELLSQPRQLTTSQGLPAC